MNFNNIILNFFVCLNLIINLINYLINWFKSIFLNMLKKDFIYK